MINKIQPNQPPGHTNHVNQVLGSQGEQPEKIQQTGKSAVELNLSSAALALAQIMEAVREEPDVRYDVVQQIKSQIEAGNYRIDVETLAEKLLPFMK